MKTKLLFFWLFVLFTTTVIGQTLTISSPGYTPVVISTTSTINVRPGTQITIGGSGGGATYWTCDVALATPPNPSFPVNSPVGNAVTITMPTSDLTITCYFASPTVSVAVNLIANSNIATGLFAGQNIQSCSGTTANFNAVTPYQTGFTYVWQEFNGSSWINLGASSYYSAAGHVFSLQSNSSIVGKRFKCIVTNPNCFGAIDETGEIVIQNVYPIPTATFSPNVSICNGGTATLVVTPSGGNDPYTVTMTNGAADLVSPNNINPVTGIGIGGTATFSVATTVTTIYHWTVTNQNGCSADY